MDVFISWSGKRSQAAAESLRSWLPKIINAIDPWLSSADVDKGARWATDIAMRLEAAKVGIICLTPDNLHSDWILFEAGALSKTIHRSFVCPLLIGVEPTDVKGPLAQFQATRVTKHDILKLLKTLNSGLGDKPLADAHIEEAFEVWWPKLDSQLKALPTETGDSLRRADRDLLEEILSLVRNQNRMPDWPLSDEDMKQVIQSRVWKAVRSVYGAAGGSFAAVRRGADFEIQLDTQGCKFTLLIPSSALPEEIERMAKAQIQVRNADPVLVDQEQPYRRPA